MSPRILVNSFAETLAEVLESSKRTQKEIAEETGIPAPHLTQMKKGRRRCTPDYDLRLSRCFGTSEGFWLRLQMSADLRAAKAREDTLVRRRPAASRRSASPGAPKIGA